MKTLVIDAQIWQTNAWYRGMGGYTRSLIAVFVKQNSDTKVVVLLNKNIPTEIERLDAIKAELVDAEVHQLDLPVDPEVADEPHATTEINRFIQDHFSDQDDLYYFVPALFLFNYVAVFPDNVKKIVLFYDLIPLVYWEHFAKYFPPHLYFPRFKLLFEADIVFTISETTANDLVRYFGLPRGKMVNLDGSINQVTGDDERSRDLHKDDIIQKLGLEKKQFFLMPTGGLSHKNNVRAAQAFRQLKQSSGNHSGLRLVVTSFFETLEREELQLIDGKDIIFTGNITDKEIASLYAECDVVLFPSLYEGLGIPALEGIINQKPVACSDISVFREIPNYRDALYVFDPKDIASISSAMFLAIAKAGFSQKQKAYPAIMEKYSWQRSASIFAVALSDSGYFLRKQQASKRIAVTCPDPRKNNDVAVFAQRLYGYCLAAGIELVYFIDPGEDIKDSGQFLPDYIRYMATCYDIQDFYREVGNQHFDQIIHFSSNDAQFSALLRAILYVPGYIYLGNDNLLNLFEEMAEKGMISGSQLEAEQKIRNFARDEKFFEDITLLFGARGVIAEKHIYKTVAKTLQREKITLPLLELPECLLVNSSKNNVETQSEIYEKFIDFIGRTKE